MSPPTHRRVPVLGRCRWPDWPGYAAGAWSVAYGVAGLYWSTGGAGFPFGSANDPAADLSILSGVRAAFAAPIIAALGLAGGGLALLMARGWGRGLARAALMVLAMGVAVALALVIPDYRVLVFVAYAPIVLIGAPFGWPPGANLLGAVTWPLVNQFVCIGGGLAWAAAGLAYARRTRGACSACGRGDIGVDPAAPAAAARWGSWAVLIAVVIPLIYAATRWAWAVGIPLGITEELLREGQASGLWLAGAALATLAVVGAILTVGLIRPWGEVFPRWLPLLSGKRVPPALAIVPAAVVSVLVTTAGVMFVRLTLAGGFSLDQNTTFTLGDGNWAALAPELLWPIWGVALAAATLAYYYRRRGPCTHCGRG